MTMQQPDFALTILAGLIIMTGALFFMSLHPKRETQSAASENEFVETYKYYKDRIEAAYTQIKLDQLEWEIKKFAKDKAYRNIPDRKRYAGYLMAQIQNKRKTIPGNVKYENLN